MGQDISLHYHLPREDEEVYQENRIEWLIPESFNYSPDQLEELRRYSLCPGSKFQINASGTPEALDAAPKVKFPEKFVHPLYSLLMIPDDSINLLYNPIENNYCISFRYHSNYSFELFCYLNANVEQSNRHLRYFFIHFLFIVHESDLICLVRVQSSGLTLDRYVCEAGENIVFNSSGFSLPTDILTSLNSPEPDYEIFSIVLLVASLDEHKEIEESVGFREKDHPAVELYGFQPTHCKKKLLMIPKEMKNGSADSDSNGEDYEFFLDYYAFKYYRDVYTSRLIYQSHQQGDGRGRDTSLSIPSSSSSKDGDGLRLDQIYPQLPPSPPLSQSPQQGRRRAEQPQQQGQQIPSIFDRIALFFSASTPSTVVPQDDLPEPEPEHPVPVQGQSQEHEQVTIELARKLRCHREENEDYEEEKSSDIIVAEEGGGGDDNKTTRSEDKCVICFTRDPEVLLFPCQHTQFCLPCLQRSAAAAATSSSIPSHYYHQRLQQELPCPLCRREVTFLLKVSPSSSCPSP